MGLIGESLTYLFPGDWALKLIIVVVKQLKSIGLRFIYKIII